MADGELLKFALEVLDKGGPVAFAIFVIGAVWFKFGMPRGSGTEAQMTAALRELSATVKANHETAEAHREEMKDSMSDLGQRVARIEGRIERR